MGKCLLPFTIDVEMRAYHNRSFPMGIIKANIADYDVWLCNKLINCVCYGSDYILNTFENDIWSEKEGLTHTEIVSLKREEFNQKNGLFTAFSTPANAVPMHIVSAIGNAAAWGFIGTGMLGIRLKCLKEERRIPQLALLAVISGLFGFLLTVVMGKFVDWLQVYIADGNTIFTYAQQLTNILGVAAIGITIIYMRKTFKGM